MYPPGNAKAFTIGESRIVNVKVLFDNSDVLTKNSPRLLT